MSRPGKLCFALAVGASTAYLLVRRRIQERKQRGRVVIASCDEIVESRRAYEIAAADEKGFFRQLTETGVDYDFKSWTDDTVDWGKYRVVVCRSMWDYSESPDKHARFVQWVEKLASLRNTVVINNPAFMLRNSHKSYLQHLSLEHGVPTIPTWWIYPGQPIPQLSSAFEDSEWSDIIIKPAIACNSRGTIRVTLTSPESVRKGQALMEQLLLQGEELMCQPFLPSVQEAGEVSVMFLCGKIMHSIVKWPRSGDFRVQGDFGGRTACRALTALQQRHAQAIIDILYGKIHGKSLDWLKVVPKREGVQGPPPLTRSPPHHWQTALGPLPRDWASNPAVDRAMTATDSIAAAAVNKRLGLLRFSKHVAAAATEATLAAVTPRFVAPMFGRLDFLVSPKTQQLLLLEVEALEPSLYFRHNEGMAIALAGKVLETLSIVEEEIAARAKRGDKVERL